MTDQRRRARIVEAYPVTETADGSRVAPSLAYTGPISIFEERALRWCSASPRRGR